MDRRTFLGAVSLGGAASLACVATGRAGNATIAAEPPKRAGAAERIRAVAFDLFTLFDPRSIDAAVVAETGDPELARVWKSRAFEYCWLRAAAGQYRPFDAILGDALDYALAARALPSSVTPAARARLLASWTELAPWPDTAGVLEALRRADLVLAPLANFAPSMIERLLSHAKLRGFFAHVISTDAARSYKPDPRAYQLGVEVLDVPRETIAFSAFGSWDAAGASWFGYPTFWVNRLGVERDLLDAPTATGQDLVALASWIETRGRGRAP